MIENILNTCCDELFLSETRAMFHFILCFVHVLFYFKSAENQRAKYNFEPVLSDYDISWEHLLSFLGNSLSTLVYFERF